MIRVWAVRPFMPVPDQTAAQPGYQLLDVTARPWPTVKAAEPGSGLFAIGGEDPVPDRAKPPYRVPSMAEVAAAEPCGFTVVTTFAGGGGSSTGYEMAGYRVVWANEFVKAAGDTYHANHPATILDRRDIRDVTAADILAATGLAAGELDLLDGSPPCDPFSMSGRREAMWGKIKPYSEERAQRTDDLFFEFVRLLAGLMPRTFVAENVAGLVRGTAKGYFKLILRAMRQAGYRVQAKLLDASWLGVPQARQRVIFAGVRDDLGMDPAFPRPLPYRYTVRDALPWIGAQGASKGFTKGVEPRPADGPSPAILAKAGEDAWRNPAAAVSDADPAAGRIVTYGRATEAGTEDDKYREHPPDQPAPSILAGGVAHVARSQYGMVVHDPQGGPRTQGDVTGEPSPTIKAQDASNHMQVWQTVGLSRDRQGANLGMPQVGDVTDQPAATITASTGQDQAWQAEGVHHDTAGQYGAGDVTDRPAPTITTGVGGLDSYHFQVGEAAVPVVGIGHGPQGQFAKGGDITDAPARTVEAVARPNHLQAWEDPACNAGLVHDPHPGGGFDSAGDVTDKAMPTIEGGRRGRTHHAAVFGAARDDRGRPVDPETGQDLTIGEHTAVYQAWVKHFAAKAGGRPVTCRKLTLGELRRLGGFPDDYQLTGTYSQRWERVGQSVPPVMMRHVAAAIRDQVLVPLRDAGRIT